MIDKFCSVCCLKDIRAWGFAAQQILNFIEAKNYYLIVPDAEVDLFKIVTPINFIIQPESDYCAEYNLSNIKSILPSTISNRAGWYLQQILKIQFCRKSEYGESILIWDSDTIPLKKLNFIDDAGKFEIYQGIHFPKIHEPYFTAIKSLTGIERELESSFISQNIIVKSDWIKDLCEYIENYTGLENWMDALFSKIDFSHSYSAFSEYELIGVFINKYYKNDWKFKNYSDYYRNGTALVGDPRSILNKDWCLLKEHWDYLTFENYETNFVKGLNIGCGNDRMERTETNDLFINVDLERYQAVDMVMDVTKKFPFPDSQFDLVIANNILEHVDCVLSVVSEIDRTLRVGGILKIEVPFIGSYNHGTDVTHKRGMTYTSFNFLFKDNRNYLFREDNLRKFNYKLIKFERENVVNGYLVREYFSEIPRIGEYTEWIDRVRNFQIPGTIGFHFMKC